MSASSPSWLGLQAIPRGADSAGGEVVRPDYSYRKHPMFPWSFKNYNLIDYLTPLENVRPVNKQAGKRPLRVGLDEGIKNQTQCPATYPEAAAGWRPVLVQSTIILADEPTGNLDEQTAGDIVYHLKSCRNAKKCVIVVTHSKGSGRGLSSVGESRWPRREEQVKEECYVAVLFAYITRKWLKSLLLLPSFSSWGP